MRFILKNEFTIALLAAILFIPFLGHVHLFDWDEINFAESAREMMQTGDYFSVQINYQRFWEKPPLFFWMQVLSMKAFGINEFAARFPNAVCGIVTLITLFRIGKRNFNETFGRIWVMIYLGTLLTFLYFKSGIIDPWFNLFIFLGIYHFYFLTIESNIKRSYFAFYAGLFLGLAVLTKGPVAIIISLLSYATFVITHRFRLFISLKELLIILITITIVCFGWFGVDLIKNGPSFLSEFIQYQVRLFSTGEADHGEPFFYHWWVLLIGCFPASVFFMRGMFIKTATIQQKFFKQWMLILFWITLLLFSIVTTKIIHYSSLCWFPLTFLAAIYVHDVWVKKELRLNPWLKSLVALVGISLGIIITAIPFIMMNKDKWVNKVNDVFARANLEANVHWAWTDGIGGLILLGAVFYYLIAKNQQFKLTVLFSAVTVCCLLTALKITPKIEAISQRANIEFFEKRQGEDCYVETWGYKSYAQYFYTQKKQVTKQETRNNNWLLRGTIDKPAYFSAKVQDRNYLDTVPGVKKLYEKNGFVFYKRMPEEIQR